ncbi:MAG: ribosome biogenesis GTPase YlqF [Mastigocoleus sp.]
MALNSNYKLSLIQWYPGHIAKAEKKLQEQLKLVDVVLEVRDTRIPLATHHPHLDKWIGSKKKIVILNRVDMIFPEVRQQWQDWFKSQGQTVYFSNAKQGIGAASILKAAQSAAGDVNKRRRKRGMLPRPIRAVVIGFPNVGKSALINRLLKRKIVESAARPGVTRQLRWVRISQEVELLDAPGVIPLKLEDQEAALKLAICDDIGQASYDKQIAAAAFVDLLTQMEVTHGHLLPQEALKSRYGVDTTSLSGEEYIRVLADNRYQGNIDRSTSHILTDFRKGNLGQIPLELPPLENQ